MLQVITIDNVTGEHRAGVLTDGYIESLEVPVAGLLRALNAANWKGS